MGILKKLGDRLDLMGKMAAQCAVPDEAGTSAVMETGLRGAIWRCAGCRNAEECKHWLDVGGENRTPPAFCANAGFFSDIKAGG